jgi:crotonobetainyl-CoA:carnitine CoA-transferase CaiB-like acyl-CoA transferase
MTSSPLSGIRVLDLTRVLSGPHCTRMLCDLGAEVIKLEPPEGDLTRFSFPRVGSMATYFAQQNAGKEDISFDLRTPEAQELTRQLADQCDVIVENFRPGVMAKLGLDYDTLMQRNPRLIIGSINGYGSTGPWVHRRAYAPLVGAETGFTLMQAMSHDGHLANDWFSHADVYTGIECCVAILAALYQRGQTGKGQRVEVSMAQTMLYVNEHAHDQLFDREVPEGTIRSFEPGLYPVYTVANGVSVVVGGHPAENGVFTSYLRAMGRPELANDPRFISQESRLQNLKQLKEIFGEWAATFPDADSLEEVLDDAGLVLGAVRSVNELSHTDWAQERNAVIEINDRQDGTIRVPNVPWEFSAATVGTTGAPRFRGEDNHAVLSRLLGSTEEELAKWDEQGVLSSRMPKPPTAVE